MDRQQETTEQIHRKERLQFQESASFFPLDLISEILSKLPLKSVVRFRSVSKLWSSITTDPFFINTFETRSTRKKPSLVLCFKRDDKLFVLLIPQDHPNSNEPHSTFSLPVDSYYVTYPKFSPFSPKESVHGLICCFPEAANPIIWNPTMRKFLTLIKPEKSWKRVTFFLGYDPVEGKNKVLCMPFDKTIDKCRVLTLGSAQESWRWIKTNHKHRLNPFLATNHRYTIHECINGVLYYKAYTDQTENVDIIMSFDVRSEEFHVIKVPWNNIGGKGILATYEGRLACVKSNASGDGTTLWILRDAEKHQWWLRNFHVPLPFYDQSLKKVFNFIGITDAGEFVYVPTGFHKSFYILYYDPKINRFHRVELKGIADDEFRLKNGLVNRRLYNIHAVLNHIESLMPF